MRNNRFGFKIDGEDVSPETVSFGDLHEIVKALERALAATVTANALGQKPSPEELSISLVAVSEGSDSLTLAVSGRMLKAASIVSHSLANNDFSGLSPKATRRLRELWVKSNANSWTFEILPDGNGVANARITPDVEILKPMSLRGRTTVYGLCERVGGADRQTLLISLVGGGRCTFRIKTKELARQIGQRLHTVIGLDGEAVWDAHTLELDSFVADALLDYKETTLTQAFAELAKSANGFWDDIDPDEYVKELRAD